MMQRDFDCGIARSSPRSPTATNTELAQLGTSQLHITANQTKRETDDRRSVSQISRYLQGLQATVLNRSCCSVVVRSYSSPR